MTTDAALLRKILHTLGRPTQAELDAGLAAVQRMEAVSAEAVVMHQRQSTQLAEAREFCGIATHKLNQAEALLRELEWSSSEVSYDTEGNPDGREMCCPSCHWIGVHAPDCKLALALKDAP